MQPLSERQEAEKRRAAIEAQVDEYLKNGGKVQTIPTGACMDDRKRIKVSLFNYEGTSNG